MINNKTRSFSFSDIQTFKKKAISSVYQSPIFKINFSQDKNDLNNTTNQGLSYVSPISPEVIIFKKKKDRYIRNPSKIINSLNYNSHLLAQSDTTFDEKIFSDDNHLVNKPSQDIERTTMLKYFTNIWMKKQKEIRTQANKSKQQLEGTKINWRQMSKLKNSTLIRKRLNKHKEKLIIQSQQQQRNQFRQFRQIPLHSTEHLFKKKLKCKTQMSPVRKLGLNQNINRNMKKMMDILLTEQKMKKENSPQFIPLYNEELTGITLVNNVLSVTKYAEEKGNLNKIFKVTKSKNRQGEKYKKVEKCNQIGPWEKNNRSSLQFYID